MEGSEGMSQPSLRAYATDDATCNQPSPSGDSRVIKAVTWRLDYGLLTRSALRFGIMRAWSVDQRERGRRAWFPHDPSIRPCAKGAKDGKRIGTMQVEARLGFIPVVP